MNDAKKYLNYFSFLKNLKKGPDTGMTPLVEWQQVVFFFSKIYSYLNIEWNVNLDNILESQINGSQHRQIIADLVVYEFRMKNNIGNTAVKVVDYLKANNLLYPE